MPLRATIVVQISTVNKLLTLIWRNNVQEEQVMPSSVPADKLAALEQGTTRPFTVHVDSEFPHAHICESVASQAVCRSDVAFASSTALFPIII